MVHHPSTLLPPASRALNLLDELCSFECLVQIIESSNHLTCLLCTSLLCGLLPLSVSIVTLFEPWLCPLPIQPSTFQPGKNATSLFIPARCSFVYFSLVRTLSVFLHPFPFDLFICSTEMGRSFLSSFLCFFFPFYFLWSVLGAVTIWIYDLVVYVSSLSIFSTFFLFPFWVSCL